MALRFTVCVAMPNVWLAMYMYALQGLKCVELDRREKFQEI